MVRLPFGLASHHRAPWCVTLSLMVVWSSGGCSDVHSGPFVLPGPDDSVRVVFAADDSDPCGDVVYGTSERLGAAAPAHRRTGDLQEACATTVDGLTPGATYSYAVDRRGEVSDVQSFRAPVPPGTPFRFDVIGDTRTNDAPHQQVVQAALADGLPDLLLSTGDMVAVGSSGGDWTNFLRIEAPLLRHVIFAPAYGNHEAVSLGGAAPFDGLFPTGHGYKFIYGNALFVALNTEETSTEGSPQYLALEATLQEAIADPSITFKFVFYHKPAVTTCANHDPNADILNGPMQLFERYGVNAVFTGHNHLYEHGVVNGVHYVVTAGGGADLKPFLEPYEPDGWTIVHRESVHHFVRVDVGPDRYTFTAIRADGTVMDTYTSTVDEHGVPGPVPPDLVRRASSGSGGCAGAPNPSNMALVALALLAVGLGVGVRRWRARGGWGLRS